MRVLTFFHPHFLWIITAGLFLQNCAQPMVAVGPTPPAGDETFQGSPKEFERRVVANYCGEGGDADDDGLCDDDEEAACRGVYDCNGNGVADGWEPDLMDKNPMAMAVSQIAGIATRQAMAEPEGELRFDEGLKLNDRLGALQPILQQKPKPVIGGGGKLLSTSVALGIGWDADNTHDPFKNGDTISQLHFFYDLEYEQAITIDGTPYSTKLQVLHCVGSYPVGNRRISNATYEQDLTLLFELKAFDPKVDSVSKFSSASACDTFGPGLYLGVVGFGGEAISIFRQSAKFAGYRPSDYAGYVTAPATLQSNGLTTPDLSGFRFVSQSGFNHFTGTKSRTLYARTVASSPLWGFDLSESSPQGCQLYFRDMCEDRVLMGADHFGLLTYTLGDPHRPMAESCDIWYTTESMPTESSVNLDFSQCTDPPQA